MEIHKEVTSYNPTGCEARDFRTKNSATRYCDGGRAGAGRQVCRVVEVIVDCFFGLC